MHLRYGQLVHHTKTCPSSLAFCMNINQLFARIQLCSLGSLVHHGFLLIATKISTSHCLPLNFCNSTTPSIVTYHSYQLGHLTTFLWSSPSLAPVATQPTLHFLFTSFSPPHLLSLYLPLAFISHHCAPHSLLLARMHSQSWCELSRLEAAIWIAEQQTILEMEESEKLELAL